MTEIKEVSKIESETDEAVGKIKIIKTGTKITHKIIDSNSKFSLEYAP